MVDKYYNTLLAFCHYTKYLKYAVPYTIQDFFFYFEKFQFSIEIKFKDDNQHTPFWRITDP